MPYRHQRRADSENDRSDDHITFFLPSDGIDYDVIAAEIKCSLGPDASVEKAVLSRRPDKYGYYVQSSKAITRAMILDLKRNTCEWASEQKSNQRLSYVASRTYFKSHQCHPRNCNTLRAVHKAHDWDWTTIIDLEKPAYIDQFSGFIQGTESRVFESLDIPPVGFRRKQLDGMADLASTRESGALCASLGGLALVSLRDMHMYLTEISYVVGGDEGETCEINLEYVRLKSFVLALRRLCGQATKHDVNFIIENPHNWDRTDYSLKGAQRLLDCIGISDPCRCGMNGANRKGHKESAPFLKDDIFQLMQALVEKATDATLILVYHSVEGGAIEKALSECLGGKDKSWVQSRVACLLPVDTIYAPDSQIQCDHRHLITNERDTCSFHRPRHQSQASSDILGYFKCTRLHRVFTSTLPLKHVRRLQTGFQRTPMFLATRRNFLEVWCGREEFVDCLLWSIMQAMQEGRLQHRKSIDGQPGAFVACLRGPDPEPLSSFTSLLSSKESAKASMILKALRWVAFSRRPLSIHELVAAVVTSTDLDLVRPPCTFPQSSTVSTDAAELLESCKSFLEASQDGYMVISDENLRDYILSPATSVLDPCREVDIHEMITVVCMRHLQCLHSERLFRPWLGTVSWLSGEIKTCDLHDYSTRSWHEHFRRAESHSRRLSALLDENIRLALDYYTETIPQSVKSDQRVNYGLWLCGLYDLSSVGRLYLQMNPNMEAQHFCSERLLHIAAANGSLNMLKLLLGKSTTARKQIKDTTKAVPDLSVCVSLDTVASSCVPEVEKLPPRHTPVYCSDSDCREGVTPLQLAAYHGHVDAVRILLQHDSEDNAIRSGTLENALHLAAQAGHEEIVRSLLLHGADLEARNAAGLNALQIAVQERHTSVIDMLIEQFVDVKPHPFPQSVPGDETLGELDQVGNSNRLCLSDARKGSLGHRIRPSIAETSLKLLIKLSKLQAQNGDEQTRNSDRDEWCIVSQSDIQMDLE